MWYLVSFMCGGLFIILVAVAVNKWQERQQARLQAQSDKYNEALDQELAERWKNNDCV